MSATDAREKVIADFDALGLLEKIEEHTHKVPKGSRSGVTVEPLLTDQWFVKMEGLAAPAIEAVKSGRLKFTPENWSKTYLQWLENIQDWCISRQLWWGHRIPAWYDEQGEIYVGQDEADVRKRFNLGDEITLRQDDDVLDTWFTSALWPFATLGWPDNTEALNTFYPTNVLMTGFDIIFFWVARMVMMGIHFMGDVPFKEVYVTGLIRDSQGQKMSKSKGNVLDPLDLIHGITLDELLAKRTQHTLLPKQAEKIAKATKKEFPDGIPAFGTDALRFSFCVLANSGRNINFDLGRIEGNRNFCNKLWNAARFVLMHAEQYDLNAARELQPTDHWILSIQQQLISDVERHIKQYRFDLAAQALYEFSWNQYCDWYLEFSKTILMSDQATDPQKQGVLHTLLQVLETTLRLIHPMMPFVSEEIWQTISAKMRLEKSHLVEQSYPTADASLQQPELEAQVEQLKSVITAIRTIRSEMNIKPSKKIPVLVKSSSEAHDGLAPFAELIKQLARLESLEHCDENTTLEATATAVVNALEIHIPLAGLIDVAAEKARLQKEIDKLEKEITKARGKLDNPNYVNKAPAAVVEKEREKLTALEEQISALKQSADNLVG